MIREGAQVLQCPNDELLNVVLYDCKACVLKGVLGEGRKDRWPSVVVPYRTQEVMALGGQAVVRCATPFVSYAKMTVGDRLVPFGFGVVADGSPEQAALYEKDQMLIADDRVYGWVRGGSITLVKDEQVADQVEVALHGFSIVQVLLVEWLVVGVVLVPSRYAWTKPNGGGR